MKIKQLTTSTIKDLKLSLKERSAEIEVLKEMVKSANLESKAKEIDIQRLKNKLLRIENSSDTARIRQHSANPSVSKSPKRLNNRNEIILETDAKFEQTGKDNIYDIPKMNKSRQQEWEEAVELDRVLEVERREKSLKRL